MNTQQIYQTESNQQSKKEIKGYMAVRNNVYELKLELWGKLKPLEYFMIDLIIERTIKWRQKEAKVTLEWFCEKTGQRKDHIYVALSALEKLGIIVRRKIRHDLFIGLNEDYFGKLLIEKHEKALLERKKKVKIIVDNSKSNTENRSDLHPSSVSNTPDLGSVNTELRSKNNNDVVEITEEMTSLKTPLKDTNLKKPLKESQNPESGTGESYTLFWEREPKQIRTQEDHLRIIRGQLERLKIGVAL